MSRSWPVLESLPVWEAPPLVGEPIVRPAFALIAHDHKKSQLVDLAICYRDILSRHRLVATAATGRMLSDLVGLEVECLRSKLDGGDGHIADCIAVGGIAAVIFLLDPFHPPTPGPEVAAVLRVCNILDIPIAINLATATALLNSISVLDVHADDSRGSLEDK